MIGKRFLPAMLFALALLYGAPAMAQGCGQQNPNCIVATAPVGTSNNQAASTAFVQQNGGWINLSGDCTATAQGVITCPKANGVLFGSMAFQNANNVAITGGTITGLPNPTNASDAATKNYVDSISSGIVVLPPSGLATAAVLPNTPTYANGTLGVGATLTAGSNTTLTVDGTAAPLNTVVLVKNQASAFQNGIYTVTQAGSGSVPWILTRATYFDIASQMKAGAYTFVTAGAANANSAYTLQTTVTTVGTDPLNWLLFSQGSTSVASGGAVIATRAAAAALNLSTYTTVTTQGYANPGDGGGATFKNVGTAPFIDSFISTGFVNQAGTGCTNGTYTGVYVAGSATGTGAVATIVVSGGSVTSVSFNVTPGNSYLVGDQLTQNGAFTCSGSAFNWQVASTNGPSGSFADSAGNHWQIVVDQGNNVNVRQFGAKCDWNPTAGDAGSTNDTTSIQHAMWFAYHGNGTQTSIAAGGIIGGKVSLPSSTCLAGVLTTPQGVWLDGAGRYASLLKVATIAGASNFITMCDPNTQVACFGARISNFGIFPGGGTPSALTSMIFTNDLQQEDAISHIVIQPGQRECINIQTGFGGAALFGIDNVECGPNNASSNPGIVLNYGAAVVNLKDSVVESSSWSGSEGIVVPSTAGGVISIDGVHTEGITAALLFQPGANVLIDVQHVTGGSSAGGCGAVLTRQSGSATNQIRVGMITPNGCSTTFNNAGAATTGNIVQNTLF